MSSNSTSTILINSATNDPTVNVTTSNMATSRNCNPLSRDITYAAGTGQQKQSFSSTTSTVTLLSQSLSSVHLSDSSSGSKLLASASSDQVRKIDFTTDVPTKCLEMIFLFHLQERKDTAQLGHF